MPLYFKGKDWDIKNKKSIIKRLKYCYLVYCNPDPKLVYAVYSKKNEAKKYALSLIKFREKRALDRGYKFDFYHYFDIDKDNKNYKDSDFNRHVDKMIFSTCLEIKEDKSEFSDDGFTIQVIRKPLL